MSMSQKISYKKCCIQNEGYYFDSNKFTDEDLKTFNDSFHLIDNYDLLKIMFSLNPKDCEFFAIYEKEILSDQFIENFRYGMNNRWSSKDRLAFDPAIHPLFTGYCLDEEELMNIQKVLVTVNKKYGSIGLTKLREINLAQGVMEIEHYIPVFDPNDYYDLPADVLIDGTEYKEILLDKSEYHPVKRTLDVLNCEIFINYSNENVKSALFSMPHLLYDEDGNFLDDQSISNLLQMVSKRLGEPKEITLNYEDMWKATHICYQIYLEQNLEKYRKLPNKLTRTKKKQ